jgi:ABC-type transport system substrate-binding protein
VAPLNARPFVAADIKFAYDRYRAGGQGTAYFANVDAVEAPDDDTVRVTMKRAVADFINSLGGRYLTIFPHELVDDGSIERRLIGTGPMILKEATPASTITYQKNPDYFRRAVLLDGAEHRIMPDASARLAAFRAGQTETGYSVVTSQSDVKNLLATNPTTPVQLSPILYAGFTFALNLALPKYQDERVRQAISMSIDRNFIIQTLYEGLGKSTPALPWSFVLDNEPTEADLGPYMQFNPSEAKRLLAAAGTPNLEINSFYFAYANTQGRISEILTDQLRATGITLRDRSADYTEFNSQWTTRKLPEATTVGWESLGYDADNFFYNHLHSTSPGNRWNVNDPQIDKWAEAQQVELDPLKRRAIHKQIWDYGLQKVLRIAEPTAFGFSVLQPWVRGLRSGSALGGSLISYDDGAMIESAWLDK